MTIGKQMIEQLRMLASEPSAFEGMLVAESDYKRLVVSAESERAVVEFFDHDRYSVTLRALDIGAGAAVNGDVRAYLSEKAAAIARNLSYLEEPLAVWELDKAEQIAQLRSSPPQRDGEEILYWEVLLSAGAEPGAQLMRYRWAPGMTEREPIAYPATFALLGRIADSLSAALRIAS